MSSSTSQNSDQVLQQHLNHKLETRAYPKTICPSEVPRALVAGELAEMGASNWRELMPDVRKLVWEMRDRGEVEILQHGEALGNHVGLEDVKGPIRVRRKTEKLDMTSAMQCQY